MKKADLLDNPARNQAVLRNLVKNYRLIGVQGWLEEVSFEEVVEAWFEAQAGKAAELARVGALNLLQ